MLLSLDALELCFHWESENAHAIAEFQIIGTVVVKSKFLHQEA